MSDDAEDIGGISVSISASHRQLASDLAEANRQLDAWAKQRFEVKVGAQFQGAQAGGSQPAAGAGSVAVGGVGVSSALESKLDALVRSLQQAPAVRGRVQAAAKTIDDEIGQYPPHMQAQMRASYQQAQGRLPGETRQTESFRPIQEATHQMEEATSTWQELQAESQKPLTINLDTQALQTELQAVLGTMKEIAAVAAEIAETSTMLGSGGGGGGSSRRKNIRDQSVGTEANPNRIYTFEPQETAREQAQAAAAARATDATARTLDRQRRESEPSAAEDRFIASLEQAQKNPVVYSASPETPVDEARAEARAERDREATSRRLSQAALRPQSEELDFLAALQTAQTPLRSPTTRGISPEAERDLLEMSYENQQNNPAVGSRSFAQGGAPQQRSQEEIAAGNARRAEIDAQLAARVGTPESDGGRPSEPYLLPEEREAARGRGGGRGGEGLSSSAAQRRQTDEAIARAEQQRIARSESTTVSAGRTFRTGASGVTGFFFGGGRERVEAQNALTSATQRRVRAERDVAEATEHANRPEIQHNVRAYRDATDDLAAAREKLVGFEKQEAAALEKVQSFSGPGAALRNLAAIGLGGAALGLGLKAVDIGIAAIGKSLAQTTSEATDFAGVSQQVTDDLAKQARQASGNVDAVVSQREAYAGLSASAAEIISPLTKQRTEIVAGTQAFADLVDQYQNYQAIIRQGGAGAALTQETGGVGGLGIFGQHSAEQELRRLVSGLPAAGIQEGDVTTPGYINRLTGPQRATPQDVADTFRETTDAVTVLNEQLERGGGTASRFATQAQLGAEKFAESIKTIQDAGFGELARELQSAGVGVTGVSGRSDVEEILNSLTASNLTPDTELLKEQFNRQTAAQIGAAGREQQFQSGTQLPTQFALQRLAAPTVPVGTGIAAANADEQERITSSLQEANDLQAELNTRYDQGRQVLEDTYRPAIVQNFGQAAGRAFDTALSAVERTGQQIAAIQAGISNEQAAYQTAQYNFQLMIAKRNLSDIGGLTGKNFGAGQSYLGVLERQNLQLSRQAQLLQFSLSQRQINFQQAVAGFQAPGVTPEERQANVKQAQIEAEFAQKQLNIQREMFGNQVQIVDISNLRQGADLVAQIGLLTQGRQVQIDTAVAEQKIIRLQQLQQQNVAQVGTYITAVDKLINLGFTHIAQLEAAAGRAMVGLAQTILGEFGIYIQGLTSYVNQIGGRSSQTGQQPGKSEDDEYHARGALMMTNGPMRIGPNGVAGEAGDEAILILARPRSGEGTMGGGVTNNFYITGNSIRSDSDIETLANKVVQRMGTRGALAGLRLPG